MKHDEQAAERLSALLSGCAFFSGAVCCTCVPSTNDLAKELAAAGRPQGMVVVAEGQTKGRGRMGRQFFSPVGSGLYMSLLLRPEAHQRDAGLLTACGAVAVQQALLALTGLSADIKWVNDLYCGGKKLCGILAEGHFNRAGEPDYVILGIGLNVTVPPEGYPADISRKTTALSELVSAKGLPDRLTLCAEIVKKWALLYEALPDVGFLDIYRRQSCVLGRPVSYIQKGQRFSGEAVAIDEKAQLVIRLTGGETVTLGTGEVSLELPCL